MDSIELKDFAIFIVSLVTGSVPIIYFLIKYNYGHWSRENVPFIVPNFPFGNFSNVFKRIESVSNVLSKLYSISSERFVGIFVAHKAVLMLRDPELVNKILVKDFDNFSNRGVYFCDSKSDNLFTVGGERWKGMREKLTPAFSVDKLEQIFPNILKCTEPLVKWLTKIADKEKSFEAHELCSRFTTDLIASLAFGVDINSIEDCYLMFRLMGQKFLDCALKNSIRNALLLVAPGLMRKLGVKLYPEDFEDYVITMATNAFKYREKSQINRNDFVKILIELHTTGRMSNNSFDDSENNNCDNKMNQKNFHGISAHVLPFYLAGFETISTGIAFCLFELAKNFHCQSKLQEEIENVLERFDGKFTFESLESMRYLEACIKENLRLHPPIPMLWRQCTKSYPIPECNYTIKSGTTIIIPIECIHTDAKYFAKPEKYRPERFLDSENNERNQSASPFLVFGQGPRNCIAAKLGMLEIKLCVASLLKNFTFTLDKTMPSTISNDPTKLMTSSINGIHLKVNFYKN